MKSILMSIQPKWCELIASGQKTIEVRKTIPKRFFEDGELKEPFKVYIYQTKTYWSYDRVDKIKSSNGKVVGEYICDKIYIVPPCEKHGGIHYPLITYPELRKITNKTCLTDNELYEYGVHKTNGCYGAKSKVSKLFCYNITNKKIYDEPKELCELNKPCIMNEHPYCPYCKFGCLQYNENEVESTRDIEGSSCEWICLNKIIKPPQSWMYCEDLGDVE